MVWHQSHCAEAAESPRAPPNPVRCAAACWLFHGGDFPTGWLWGRTGSPPWSGSHCHHWTTTAWSKHKIKATDLLRLINDVIKVNCDLFSNFRWLTLSLLPGDRCQLWAWWYCLWRLCVLFLWHTSLCCLYDWFLSLKHHTGCRADSATWASPQHELLKVEDAGQCCCFLSKRAVQVVSIV